jgi:hypothetical protein
MAAAIWPNLNEKRGQTLAFNEISEVRECG